MLKKLWKISHNQLARPVFVKEVTENDAKITFMNNFFGTDKAEVFVNDSSFKIEGVGFDDLPDQFTCDPCLGLDF